MSVGCKMSKTLETFVSRLTFGLFLLLVLGSGCQSLPHAPKKAAPFYKTELYFGTELPDGGHVTLASWQKFLREVVTPRFREGFTVLEGYGQWLHESGQVHREQSKVLILLYQENRSRDIEAIRKDYCKRFGQQSVIRVDEKVYLDF